MTVNTRELSSMYNCWLRYKLCNEKVLGEYKSYFKYIVVKSNNMIIENAINELKIALSSIADDEIKIISSIPESNCIFVGITDDFKAEGFDIGLEDGLQSEGFAIKVLEKNDGKVLSVIGGRENGVLYGVFHLIRSIFSGKALKDVLCIENPQNAFRVLDHWDNIDGSIERGYAGKSIFFKDNRIVDDLSRIKDYARLLASIAVNGVVINNVNVHEKETKLITDEFLPDVARIADVFRGYGIKTYLSINFASPVEIGGLSTADPLDSDVKDWWKKTASKIYSCIPDFGGFLVKADSEFRSGPFTYGRNHADGANMLAEALKPYGGIVIWRTFVYNCMVDWRDRSTDRAKAAYDNFKPLDGKFMDNVVLQIKNGPMDFQIREPITPLFGAMEKTNVFMEFQITQEYTGQQKHLCFLVPLWKEALDFDTFARGEGSFVKKVVNGSLFGAKHGGIVAVANIGDSQCWTGHPLAQSNLFGFGKLAWNPDLSSEEVAEEWVKLTFGCDEDVLRTVVPMLLESREIYEEYTSPLGIGWMVNPGHHYGPSVDGYEYSHWGTYHYADFRGIGVDRTVATGTGYTAQYKEPVAKMYENINTCPDELLLFFHHVPYNHKLKSGKTVIQHIYDTHFEGVERAEKLKESWMKLEGKIDDETFKAVQERFDIQVVDAKEWRDVVNTYFYRKTGIKDEHGRKIYE